MNRIALIFLLAGLCFFNNASAQFKLRGYVYDSSRQYPLEAVSVLSTAGTGTSTNSDGYYETMVAETDSIWFSYLGKPTVKFPVAKITNPLSFDLSLQVNIPVLREVKVRPRNYRQDSLQNRQDYAKIFNYEKPGLKTVSPAYGAAAGFDLQQIIEFFQFRKKRSMLSFQKRLLEEERQKYVDYRFSKALVRRLTQLDGNELDSFMRVFRPTYVFAKYTSEYDFQLYIKKSHERYKKGLLPMIMPKDEDYELD